MTQLNHNQFLFEIADGSFRFKRDFDGMYANCPDPHGQRESAENLSHDVYLAALARIARDRFDPKSALRSLDIGCGLAHFTRRLRAVLSAAFPSIQSYGADISTKAVERASNQPENSGIRLRQANLLKPEHWINEPTSEIVTALEVLCYFKDDEIETVCAQVARLVAPGGLLAISFHLPEKMSFARYVQSLACVRRLFPDFDPAWECDYTDSISRTYSNAPFGRHIFSVLAKR